MFPEIVVEVMQRVVSLSTYISLLDRLVAELELNEVPFKVTVASFSMLDKYKPPPKPELFCSINPYVNSL